MKVERFSIQACCGKQSIMFKTDQPLTKSIMAGLVRLGFVEREHFTKAGILYMNNLDFILKGPLGSDRLTVTCQQAGCSQKLNDLEGLLLQLG